MSNRTSTLRQGAGLTAIGMALGLGAVQAHAQSQPWYAGVQQRIEHQTNVFNTAAAQQSDTVSSTNLLLGLDQPISRQRVFANLAAGINRYQNQSQLNHTAYSARLGLDWATAGNLSGNIVADASERLADFNPVGLTLGTGDNITRTHGIAGVARIGVVTRLTVEAGGSSRRTRYENTGYQSRNSNIDELFAGVKYRPAGSLVLGAAFRNTWGEYPTLRTHPNTGVVSGESFERQNLDLTAEWPITGASRIDARLSIGRDRYDTLTARDFSGVTGALTWRWQPSGRTTITTNYVRSSGDETTLSLVPGQVPYATNANRVSDTLAVTADYELTGKVKVRGGLAVVDASAVDIITSATSNDFTTTATMGVVWEATRSIRAGCDLSYRNRASRGGVQGYDSSIFGCYGEFVLR